MLPPDTAATPVRMSTAGGDSFSTKVPSPNWPFPLAPQQRKPRTLASTMAQVKEVPEPSATALLSCVAVGSKRPTLSPKPSVPTLFRPQHHTVESASTAQACSLPATTSTTDVSVSVAGGTLRVVVSFKPSWPYVLIPQQRNAAVFNSAQIQPKPLATFCTLLNMGVLVIVVPQPYPINPTDWMKPQHRSSPSVAPWPMAHITRSCEVSSRKPDAGVPPTTWVTFGDARFTVLQLSANSPYVDVPQHVTRDRSVLFSAHVTCAPIATLATLVAITWAGTPTTSVV